MDKMLEQVVGESVEITEQDLPIGQRCLKAGFVKVTLGKLHERFACDRVTENEKERAHSLLLCRHPKGHVTCHERQARWDWYKGKFSDQEAYKVCTLRVVPVETYTETEMPQRCIVSMKKAKAIGISEFHVAYPVLDFDPQHDPVLLGIIGYTHPGTQTGPIYVEVDMWE